MGVARRVARFNKHVTNRVQMLWAPRFAPWAVVIHVGRRSGREYRTPVVAAVSGSTITIALPYGVESDWVQNLLAAKGGTFVRRRREYRLTDPTVVASSGAGAGIIRPLMGITSHSLVARIG